MKLKPGMTKEPGDLVDKDRLETLEGVMLADAEGPDCGHVTLVGIGGRCLSRSI
jgi:hypothetical protein